MKKYLTVIVSLILAVVIMTGCAGTKDGSAKPIVIYDGEFSESKIIHQMAKMLVEEIGRAHV